MTDRQAKPQLFRGRLPAGLAALSVAVCGAGYRLFRAARKAAVQRVSGRSSTIETPFGIVEYAEAGAGAGPPILMIHGTGGGFDQGLAFGEALARRGYRIIAPSRFGYLRSGFPGTPSSANQADALVALLDHLGIRRLTVAGGSAGALSAVAFALRHPDRCAGLALLAPAMNLGGRDPVEMSPLLQWSVRRLLGSDLLFWLALQAAPKQLFGTLLATDPALLDRVDKGERERGLRTLRHLMPIEPRAAAMLNDARLAGAPADVDPAGLQVPTLVISCADDRFGTTGTARRIASLVPAATVHIFPTGGHIWLGHDEEVAERIAAFARTAPLVMPHPAEARAA